jgi:oligopeptidase B
MDEALPEEILLDENAEASKHSFYTVGAFEVSPDHKLLAWAEDTVGGEKYALHVKELATGKALLPEPIKVCMPLTQSVIAGHFIPLLVGMHKLRKATRMMMTSARSVLNAHWCGGQDTAGNVAWANDNRTLFYVTKDKLDRPYKVSGGTSNSAPPASQQRCRARSFHC